MLIYILYYYLFYGYLFIYQICQVQKLQLMYMPKWWHCVNIYTHENIHVYSKLQME